MAIFTAGSIPLTHDIKRIREHVYAQGRHDLDSSAIKVSLRQYANGINYIAFLPKVKLYYENILLMVSKVHERSVVVFELDYKLVGVICEAGNILDYILDKPEEYAKERGYSIVSADNTKGSKLISLNLEQQRKETWMGTFLLLSTVFLTTFMFYIGYDHLQEIPLLRFDKKELVTQFHETLETQKEQTAQMTKKVDMLQALDTIEHLMQDTHSQLRNVEYKGNKVYVDAKTDDIRALLAKLPADATIQKQNELEGSVQYCYEKI